jgi:hypothetical protein
MEFSNSSSISSDGKIPKFVNEFFRASRST